MCPAIRLPGGRTVQPRWSAVFRKQDGAWKRIPLHAAFAAPDAEAFGDSVAFPAPG
jgi:hypothetical protein